jgi:hypothetical protein
MSKQEMDEHGMVLPEPGALTPERFQRVPAGTIAALPSVFNDHTGKLRIPPDCGGEVRIRFRWHRQAYC